MNFCPRTKNEQLQIYQSFQGTFWFLSCIHLMLWLLIGTFYVTEPCYGYSKKTYPHYIMIRHTDGTIEKQERMMPKNFKTKLVSTDDEKMLVIYQDCKTRFGFNTKYESDTIHNAKWMSVISKKIFEKKNKPNKKTVKSKQKIEKINTNVKFPFVKSRELGFKGNPDVYCTY